jgi:hypothetical protein
MDLSMKLRYNLNLCIYELILLSIGIRPDVGGILTRCECYMRFHSGPRRQNWRAPPLMMHAKPPRRIRQWSTETVTRLFHTCLVIFRSSFRLQSRLDSDELRWCFLQWFPLLVGLPRLTCKWLSLSTFDCRGIAHQSTVKLCTKYALKVIYI